MGRRVEGGGGGCGGTGSSHTHQIGFPPRKRLHTTHNLAHTHTHTDDRLHTRAAANLHMHKVDGRAQTCAHMCGHTCVKRGRVVGGGAGDESVI